MALRRIVATLTTYSWIPAGEIFSIREGKNYIGSGNVRSEADHRLCDICVPQDSDLSAEHALILSRSGHCIIMDQQSANGTFVNGQRVPRQGLDLPQFAQIKTGSTVWNLLMLVAPVGSEPVPVSPPDVFMSHATEDKRFVEPLARELGSLGVNVWYDDFVLKVGDSLRESIDRGLASARFGIIVLSRAFFSKRWTQYELNGLLAREHQGRRLVLPVWYELSHDEVVGYSPSLADKVALAYPRHTIAEIAASLAARMRDGQP